MDHFNSVGGPDPAQQKLRCLALRCLAYGKVRSLNQKSGAPMLHNLAFKYSAPVA